LVYRDLLRDDALRLYLLGGWASAAGDVLAGIGFLVVVHDATGSAVVTSLVGVAQAAPYVLVGMLGGVVADRVRRLPLMLGLDIARTLLQLGTFAAVVAGRAPIPLLLVVVVALQTAGAFFNPAHRAVLPAIVPAARLPAANALDGLGDSAGPLLAPAAAAAVLAMAGPAGFFLLDAVTYAISAAALLALHTSLRRRGQHLDDPGRQVVGMEQAWRGSWRAVGAFLAVAQREPVLRRLLVSTALVVTASTWARQIGLFLAADQTGGGARLYPVLTAAVAAAGLAAGLALPLLVARPMIPSYLAGAAIWAVGIAVTAVPAGASPLVIGGVLQGSGIAVTAASRTFVLQQTLPATMIGRGFAAAAVLLYLADTISHALFALLATVLPLPALLGLAAVGMTATATVLFAGDRAHPN